MHVPEELVAPQQAAGVEAKGLVLEQVGPLDHHQEVGELGGAVRREHHPTIVGRLDRRCLAVAGRAAERGPPAEFGPDRRVGHHRRRHRVEHGDVHVPADAGAPPAAERGQRRDRGVGAGDPLPDAASGGERPVRGRAPIARGAARSLQRELRSDPVAPRARGAERRDADDDQRGPFGEQLGGEVGVGGDDDVVVGGERRCVALHVRERRRGGARTASPTATVAADRRRPAQGDRRARRRRPAPWRSRRRRCRWSRRGHAAA